MRCLGAKGGFQGRGWLYIFEINSEYWLDRFSVESKFLFECEHMVESEVGGDWLITEYWLITRTWLQVKGGG